MRPEGGVRKCPAHRRLLVRTGLVSLGARDRLLPSRSRDRTGLRRELLADQIFHLGPEVRIALTLHMAGGEAIEPRRALAPHRGFSVVKEVIAENLGFGRIGGGDP